MKWFSVLIVAAMALVPALRAQSRFRLQQSADQLTIQTPRYELAVSRNGFHLAASRAGQLVFETAPADVNLAFTLNGAAQHVTRLLSVQQSEAGLALEYDTTVKDARARIELSPEDDHVRVQTWLLAYSGDLQPALAFRLEPSGLWYGGGFQGDRSPQVFPLNRAHIAPRRFLAEGASQGTPVWYATKGIALWIRTPHDFEYSINQSDNGLLVISMPEASSVTWDLVIARNIRDVVRSVVREIGWPISTPPADYFRLPIYTTWVEHKTEVSQAKVLEYAKAIRDNKLPAGVIEIDDKWESKYGDMQFDAAKFPDPRAMTAELHRLGFRVTLWMHTFVNVDSDTFADPRTRPLLMNDVSGHPGLIRWWNGDAAVWDFTNPRAASEFRGRLDRLRKQYGIDGFKFDGGDVNLVPRDLRAMKQITAEEYSDIYNREAAAHFAWEETRVGVYSQPLGVVQRLTDKNSVWGIENGLAATLPEAITVSLRGFPYLMPDMVGGNQYDNDRMDGELLIRWAQASALMPLLQFSVGPWHFDEECVRLAREASQMHVEFAPYIIALANAVPKTGEPILRPLWYEFPEDKEAQPITDEFMVGDAVVVAPVLSKGAVTRDVYLPAGEWREYRSGKTVSGGQWLRNWPAPIETLPVFIKAGADLGLAPSGR